MTAGVAIAKSPSLLSRLAAGISAFRAVVSGPSAGMDAWQRFNSFDDFSDTSSGVPMNRRVALSYDPIWRFVNLIAGDIARIPLHLYRRLKDGSRERATDRPIYSLLRYRPNRETSAFHFIQAVAAHGVLGNGYALVVRDVQGRPLELVPLDPDATYPIRVRVGNDPYRLAYVVNRRIDESTFQVERIPASDVLHIRGLGYDGVEGYNLVQLARNSWAYGLAAQEFGARYFKNSARPDIVIEVPQAMQKQQAVELRDMYMRLLSGWENWHKPVVLFSGHKLTPIARDAKGAQLKELREHELIRSANWGGVPPHKVGAVGGRSYASLEQENLSYLGDLDRHLRAWEDECNFKLIDEREREEYYIEFERMALIRVDAQTQTKIEID